MPLFLRKLTSLAMPVQDSSAVPLEFERAPKAASRRDGMEVVSITKSVASSGQHPPTPGFPV